MKRVLLPVVALFLLLFCTPALAELRITAPTDGNELSAEAGERVPAFRFSWTGTYDTVNGSIYEDDGDEPGTGALVTWFSSSPGDMYMNIHINTFKDNQRYVAVFESAGETAVVHFIARTKVPSLLLNAPDPEQLATGVWELDANTITFLAWEGAKEYQGTEWSVIAENGEMLCGGVTEPGEEEVVIDRSHLEDNVNVIIRLTQGDETADYHARTHWINIPEGSTASDMQSMGGIGIVTIKSGGSANVRSTPSQKGTLVGRAQAGDRVLHLSTAANGWLEIRLPNGVTGYISPKLAESK